ncbi:MAG: Gfo/Idh/MocA family oxidoreductase [candidate division KSB1 bacterium]|nr:Gfo/Idh/MocA family oxidoreductase [candidate division KSB1 bacterium]
MNSKVNRRSFIKHTLKATAVLGAPLIIPGSALGKNGKTAPSDRITIGCIGMGNMGTSNMQVFLGNPDAQIVAVCDVDEIRLEKAREMVSVHGQNCIATPDFLKLIHDPSIDAISLATPDHWHGYIAVKAAENGKDIYGEKPLSHNLAEGRAICNAVQANQRIWQTGSWQRSQSNFRFGCELVRNGRIGKVHTVQVGLPEGYSGRIPEEYHIQTPPATLDYDRWLGPAPYTPYIPFKTHWNWRWQLAFGGGQLLDWIGHHADIAHWGLGMEHTGPFEIKGKGEYPKTGPWDAASRYYLKAQYPENITMIIAGGYPEIPMGTRWIGEYGWVYVNRGGVIKTNPESLVRETFGPDEVHLYRSNDHRANFIDCMKSRRPTITPAEVAHRSATPGHLGQIAMLLKRKIKFNPVTEAIINDPEASRLLSRPMRTPWKIV